MMYEAYLEDHYPPLAEAIRKATEEDQEADTDDVKRGMMKSLYLANPATLDEYILKSEEVAGPFLNYNGGVGGFDHPCADYLFVYDEDDDNIITESDTNNMAINSGNGTCPFHSGTSANDQAKKETLDAYNNVGRTAGIKGNAARARAIMTQLGYSEEDLSYLGDGDIYNFQGVANPHSVAKIQTGERVIDIGSGLGIDSFLTMRDCGADKVKSDSGSFVVGVDLAPSEVQHATRRARDRGYEVPARLRFIQGDVETLQSVLAKNNVPSEGLFDVCISNGAFCLVPDKKKAFENGKYTSDRQICCVSLPSQHTIQYLIS
jgi:protein-L-isoaspartate O-methyltransferase